MDEVATIIPTLEDIGTAFIEFHRVVIVEHNILTGCTLILWSYYPEQVFTFIYYIVWEIPKSICLGFVRRDEDGFSQNTYTSRPRPRYYTRVPEDSLPFAFHQSCAATGDSSYHVYYVESDGIREGELELFWNVISWLLLIGGILVMISYNQ